ncbi:MAG: sulfatase-like hydrolase/transferase, partial [Rhodobacteraceae bacterium]|nr:sulfatase-like hydrolase/transferase [Paracoccaceae bacterium]
GGPAKTPTLDRLAANGVRFTDFHSGCGVCSPSRAVLMTGRHHMRAGVYHVVNDNTHKMHLLEREVTIAEVLQSNGYATGHFGKWHMGLSAGENKKPTVLDHGFDYAFYLVNGAHPSHKDPVNFLRNGQPVGPMKGYSCQIVVDDAIAWLGRRDDTEAPFFLNIWFNEPHAPIAAPDEIVSQYGDLKDPAAVYTGTVDNTDRAIGRLVEKLKALGELDNTIIVYASDNGSYRNERNGPLRGAKGSNYEGGIRVPGIFYWPNGIKGGQVEDEPAGVVDLLPTICGLVGIDKPKGVHLDGSDISPILTGQREKFVRHQPLFWLKPSSSPSATIRDGKYAMVAFRDYELPQDKKAMERIYNEIEAILKKTNSPELAQGNLRSQIFNSKFQNKEARKLSNEYKAFNQFQESWIPTIKAGGFGRFELYDLDNDLEQAIDISKQHPDIVNRLKKQLMEITASVMADAPDWHLE